MPIPVEIANTTHKVDIHNSGGDTGLVTYTIPKYVPDTLFEFALNPDVGFEMAIDGTFGGTPDLIYAENDANDYTGANVSGTKVTFDNTEQPQAGTYNVKVNKPSDSDVWEFDKGSDLGLSGFVGVSMFVYVVSGWVEGNGIDFCAFDTDSGLVVGNFVNLEDYFNENEFGVYQKISIPFADLGLSNQTADSFRMTVSEKTGAGIVCYFDTIKLEETSGSKTFTVLAPRGTKFTIHEFNFTFIDDIASTFADATMPNFSYNKIMGLPKLANGISFTRIKNGKTLFSSSITCLADSTRGGGRIRNFYSDGTNTHLTLSTRFEDPVILNSRENDSISVTVNDDLSGLLSFTAVALGGVVVFGSDE